MQDEIIVNIHIRLILSRVICMGQNNLINSQKKREQSILVTLQQNGQINMPMDERTTRQ